MRLPGSLCLFAVVAAAATLPAIAASHRPSGNLGEAKAAAAAEIYKTFFELDPRIAMAARERVNIAFGCRRLTAKTFRCDWSGENSHEYMASGIVRVTFDQYGTDAVLSRAWTCAPEGDAYEATGVSACPSKSG